MMHPTLLSPWYVVFKHGVEKGELKVTYYRSPAEVTETDPNVFTDPKHAMLFMSLQTACRVANAADGLVRVIYDKDTLKEFGR